MTDFNIISTAAVIGAGSMGSGIAAHLANAGVKVHLLDLEEANAAKGIERQLKHHGFQRKENAKLVTPGSINEHADRLSEADWIVEAVFENLEVKQNTFKVIAENRKPGSVVSSNTSTIPLAILTKGLDDDFVKDFAIIHFFNPPRVMRLVELVAGPKTSDDAATKLTRICEQQLGKVVIDCRDTPGFIANRIGNFWMAVGADLALERGIDPELADTAFGKPFGVPRTGIFGLFDYVGLQLVKPIWGSLLGVLPSDDAYHRYDITKRPQFTELLEKELVGRAAGAGFYRNKGKEVYDFEAHDYRARKNLEDPALGHKNARELMSTDSPAGVYARDVFLETLRYCCDTAPEITDTIQAIDDAMKLGYGWKQGPFKLADSIGCDWIAEQYGENVPELLASAVKAGGFYPDGKVLSSGGDIASLRDREGVVSAGELARSGERIFTNDGADIFMLDGGVALLTIKTPMNSCNGDVLESFAWLANAADKGVKAAVIGNDEERAFSAGADLPLLARLAHSGDQDAIHKVLRMGAESMWGLLKAPFPVVGAVRGLALGGGLELMLHCDAVVAHAETYVGFPEPNVGLYPAWGGTVRGLERYVDAGIPNPHAMMFKLINSARPIPLIESGFLRSFDRVIQSPDHVIAEALEFARDLIDGYAPPVDREVPLTGDRLELDEGTDTDKAIANAIAEIYYGEGLIDSYELGLKETRLCPPLLVRPENAARAAHMAKTRKPLRN